jgi:hypothetical protein
MVSTHAAVVPPFISIDCDIDPTSLFESIKEYWPSIAVGNFVLFYNLTNETLNVVYEYLDLIPSCYKQMDQGKNHYTIRKVK